MAMACGDRPSVSTYDAPPPPDAAHGTRAKLTGDGAADDYFGGTVSVSGATAVIGAPLDDDNGDHSGAAYMLVRNGGVWTQQAKLTEANTDRLGSAVSLCGDAAVVSALESAYVYRRRQGVWTQEAQLEPADEPAEMRYFGTSVSVSGDTVIVGAGSDAGRGAAYVFVRTGKGWTQEAKLVVADRSSYFFGEDVSLSGDTAVIGADESAYIFVRESSQWVQQTKLVITDGMPEGVGFSLSLSGDTALVSAAAEDIGGVEDAGAVYVFVRRDGIWTQQARLVERTPGAFHYFGSDVSLSGDIALVGATTSPVTDSISEAAYVFVRVGEEWLEKHTLLANESKPAAIHFGSTVSIDGQTAIVGAPGKSSLGDPGAAYAFEL